MVDALGLEPRTRWLGVIRKINDINWLGGYTVRFVPDLVLKSRAASPPEWNGGVCILLTTCVTQYRYACAYFEVGPLLEPVVIFVDNSGWMK